MDADNSADIYELDKLLLYKDEASIIIGSRYIKGSQIPLSQSKLRIIFSRIGNTLIQVLLLWGVKDTQCGFKLCKKEAINKILPHLKIDGWGFDIELLAYARKFNFKIKEVGITWSDAARSMVRIESFFQVLYELISIFIRIKIRGN
jgi:dolichyl-phosphate beta-glucosyltransferase